MCESPLQWVSVKAWVCGRWVCGVYVGVSVGEYVWVCECEGWVWMWASTCLSIYECECECVEGRGDHYCSGSYVVPHFPTPWFLLKATFPQKYSVLFFCHSFFFFFNFWSHHTAREILAPRPEIEPAVKARSPNHWTTKEVPIVAFKIKSTFYVKAKKLSLICE